MRDCEHNEYSGIDFRSITSGVNCPTCGRKYAVKLGVDYLSKHQGEEIQVICLPCVQLKLDEIKKGLVN